MDRIILIETSAALCSAALAEDGKSVAYKESTEPRMHASQTAPFVQDVLGQRDLKVSDCSAVALSSGPGSYTGLRVGSSTAKGLCFGAGIPLISICTLDILAAKAKALMESSLQESCAGRKFSAIVPLIDARRNEVYTAIYSPEGKRLNEVSPLIIDSESFSDLRAQGPVLFIGDAADKCRRILFDTETESSGLISEIHSSEAEGHVFVQCLPTASDMASLAQVKLEAGEFEDIAYFEPFYLKEFVATTPKNKVF